ncbi:MAG: CCA tRNA nucleotidyltransferase [Lachnospiraceae bacterium]|nr:CCA tRNA nucleotidyltransferase [Lachnospiraceae bacterium]
MQINLPEKVSHIISVLKAEGYEAYAVGGCVRDCLLGRKPDDWDITTSADPLSVKRIFKRTVDTGLKHGTVTVLMGKESYEVTTYRIDGVYEDGRHPREVTFTDRLEEDLMRRDFTINALAYNDDTGIVDCFGGLSDLKNGVIRAVNDPEKRFDEDALRIMRAVRFSAQLDFKIEEKTLSSIIKKADTLRQISAERIQTELVKLLVSDSPQKILSLYETGISRVIMPEIDRMMETEQNNPHHMYNVGIHTVETLNNSREWNDRLSRADKRILRLSLLCHDMGKPDCKSTDEKGTDHFYGHAGVSEEIASRILKRLKFDNDTIYKVRTLVKYHDHRDVLTKPKLRRLMAKIGDDLMPLWFILRRCDTNAQSEYKRREKLECIDSCEKLYREIVRDKDCLTLKDLKVDGKDLITCGFKPGRQLGAALNRMLQIVLDDPGKNTREYLLSGELIKELYRETENK